MSIVISELQVADSCAPTHYTPPRRQTLTERVVLAVCGLSLFAAMGVIFAVGLSQ